MPPYFNLPGQLQLICMSQILPAENEAAHHLHAILGKASANNVAMYAIQRWVFGSSLSAQWLFIIEYETLCLTPKGLHIRPAFKGIPRASAAP